MDAKSEMELTAFAHILNMMMRLEGIPLLTYNEVPRAKL